MAKLSIYTLINSQYQVLDQAGQLPFSIVFGLCRRSPEDTDPRPLILNTKESALDVPYALANGLLKLIAEEKASDQELTLAKSQFSRSEQSGTYLTLPPPVNRKGNWKTGIVAYHYQVDPGSELGQLFKPGKKYELRFASEDLGVKLCSYDDGEQHPTLPGMATGNPKLVSKPPHGRCRFTVVPSLPWPPELRTQLQLGQLDSLSNTVPLQVSVRNTGTKPITVQTRGHQRFLVPEGPVFPEERAEARPRIIDSTLTNPITSIRVLDQAEGTVVRRPPDLGPSGPGGQLATDPRPKLDVMVTIKPEEPLIRIVDINKQLAGLKDGVYEVHLVPRGMWWCEGSLEEFQEKDDDRIPHRLWNTKIPRVMLETEDFVELRVQDGKVVNT